MPNAMHHVSVIAHNADRLISFLTDVLGLPLVSRREVSGSDVGPLLKNTGATHAISTIVGETPGGLIEVLELTGDAIASPADRKTTDVGVLALSLDVDDVSATVRAATERGYDAIAGPATVRFGRHDFTVANICVEGVRLQFTQVL